MTPQGVVADSVLQAFKEYVVRKESLLALATHWNLDVPSACRAIEHMLRSHLEDMHIGNNRRSDIRAVRLEIARVCYGREITTYKDLSNTQISAIVDALTNPDWGKAIREWVGLVFALTRRMLW